MKKPDLHPEVPGNYRDLHPEVPGNYRPVSNLPYLSKILDRAVADQLQAHIDTNGLHVKFQLAYIAPRRPSFVGND